MEQNHKLDFSVTTVSKSVIKLARTLSKGLKNDRNFEVFDGGKNIVPTFEDDLYILCLNFIQMKMKNNYWTTKLKLLKGVPRVFFLFR